MWFSENDVSNGMRSELLNELNQIVIMETDLMTDKQLRVTV